MNSVLFTRLDSLPQNLTAATFSPGDISVFSLVQSSHSKCTFCGALFRFQEQKASGCALAHLRPESNLDGFRTAAQNLHSSRRNRVKHLNACSAHRAGNKKTLSRMDGPDSWVRVIGFHLCCGRLELQPLGLFYHQTTRWSGSVMRLWPHILLQEQI